MTAGILTERNSLARGETRILCTLRNGAGGKQTHGDFNQIAKYSRASRIIPRNTLQNYQNAFERIRIASFASK